MRLFSCLILFSFFSFVGNDLFFYAEGAAVTFRSEAKLELIQAKSNALKGVIDTEKRSFAFSSKAIGTKQPPLPDGLLKNQT
jgi:hypothetical protein